VWVEREPGFRHRLWAVVRPPQPNHRDLNVRGLRTHQRHDDPRLLDS